MGGVKERSRLSFHSGVNPSYTLVRFLRSDRIGSDQIRSYDNCTKRRRMLVRTGGVQCSYCHRVLHSCKRKKDHCLKTNYGHWLSVKGMSWRGRGRRGIRHIVLHVVSMECRRLQNTDSMVQYDTVQCDGHFLHDQSHIFEGEGLPAGYDRSYPTLRGLWPGFYLSLAVPGVLELNLDKR